MSSKSTLIYVPGIAERLGRSEGQVHWMIHTGQLKTAKIAGRRAMKEADLEAWIDAQFEAEHGDAA